MDPIGIVVIVGLLGVGVWLIFAYNKVIALKNSTRDAWSGIDVQLKRRHDLIPNLVEVVRGYAAHEKNLLEDVTQARSLALKANSVPEKEAAENQLTSSLKSILAVAESYPNLMASQNFLTLQSQLTDTENSIASARAYYNANVRDLNTAIQIFPYNMVAQMFNFEPQDFFQADPEETKDVNLSFTPESPKDLG